MNLLILVAVTYLIYTVLKVVCRWAKLRDQQLKIAAWITTEEIPSFDFSWELIHKVTHDGKTRRLMLQRGRIIEIEPYEE